MAPPRESIQTTILEHMPPLETDNSITMKAQQEVPNLHSMLKLFDMLKGRYAKNHESSNETIKSCCAIGYN